MSLAAKLFVLGWLTLNLIGSVVREARARSGMPFMAATICSLPVVAVLVWWHA